jgi:hypothetical protein
MNRIFATVFCVFVLALPGFQAGAVELDPKAVVHQLPDQIKPGEPGRRSRSNARARRTSCSPGFPSTRLCRYW